MYEIADAEHLYVSFLPECILAGISAKVYS